MDDQLFLTTILQGLVEFPNDVRVQKTTDDMGVLLTIDVNIKDLGTVIGKQGSTARSIRKLMKVFGGRHKSNINVRLNEPNRTSGSESF